MNNHPRDNQTTRRLPPEILTADEVRRLMNAARQGGFYAARHKALIAVMYRAGLRVSEALALHPKDVDAAQGTVAVLRGKGGTWRVVGIDAHALSVVGEWVRARGLARGLGGAHPLFCTARGTAMSDASVRRMLAALGRSAGIDKRVHAHGLRHTFAAELRRESVDIGVISRQLGHKNLATTVRYLDHIAPVAVIEAIGARTWPEIGEGLVRGAQRVRNRPS